MRPEIHVHLRPPTPNGHLYPKYHELEGILSVDTTAPKDWRYGLDIDGRVNFDLFADGQLGSFEVMIPKQFWNVIGGIDVPHPTQAADLVIAKESLEHQSFHLPLCLITNQPRTRVYVLFGRPSLQEEWISLSDSCFARIHDNILNGFFVQID